MARISGKWVILLTLILQVTNLNGMVLLHRKPRLTVLESEPVYYFYRNIGGQTGTYSYGYDVLDARSGTSQFRSEERFANGTVIGSYGHVDSSGIPHSYNYIADERGYRVSRITLHHPTAKPTRLQLRPTSEPEVTWSRPKRPSKNRIIKGSTNENLLNILQQY